MKIKDKNINFRDNFFLLTLLPIIVLVGLFSYFRFFVNEDYFIGYEGVCDPVFEQCFVGCEDDECTEQFYYSKVVKYLPDLSRECGEDITDCDKANVCLSSDYKCSITYCNNETEESICDSVINTIDQSDNYQYKSSDDEILQDNFNDSL